MMRLKPIYSVIALCLLVAVCSFASRSAHAVCTSPSGSAGQVVYDSTARVFSYCDDTNWIAMNGPGSGSGGCTSPTVPEGQLSYNADSRVLQGCAGNVHQAMGAIGGTGNRWTQISMQQDHSCGVRSDGRGFCWGLNIYGQLGNNTTTTSRLPQEVSGNHRWTMIVAGYDFSCGITTTGTAYCWGRNQYSQIGDGGTTSSSTPVIVSGGHSWTKISSGDYHTCGINAANNLLCWGRGANGRLGDNATSNNTTPNTVTDVGGEAGNPDTWIDVTAGFDHSCGIVTSGNAYCWGAPGNGKLGNNTTSGTFNTPQAVSGGFSWTKIEAGENFTCAIRSTGAGYCWGSDNGENLGNGGSSSDVLTPGVISGGGTWTDINAGNGVACGIKNDNNAYCWGGYTVGLLGNGTTNTRGTTPMQVTNVSTGTFTSVVAENVNACGIQSDGDLYCWGQARFGATANNTSSINPAHVGVEPSHGWALIDVTRYNACGLRDDQTIMCWGLNSNGEAGIGTSSPSQISPPASITDAGPWIQVNTGGYHSCALKADQTMWCWGMGADGRTANGTGAYTNVATATGNIRWKKISSGNAFGCGLVLDSDNVTPGNQNEDEIYCWGDDTDGQQGNGAVATSDQLSPAIISVAGPWTMVETGWRHACAIRTADNTLWCWGSDASNQLGNGAATTSVETPTQVGVAQWMDVSGGQSHTCGLQIDGSAWCSGYGGNGNIGNSAFANVNVFTAASGGHVYSEISAGNHYTCGIRTSDRRLLCWGYNTYGQLGIGNFNDVAVPTLAVSTEEWTHISAGEQTFCGVTIGGRGWCSGENRYAASGHANWNNYLTPTQAGCGSPPGSAGQLAFNSATNQLQYCDGAGWAGAGGFGAQLTSLPTSGLIGYWAFDEGSGTTANDSSGNSNTGTLTNGPTWVAGRVGAYALNFDGSNDFVNAGSNAILDNLTTMTVCAWVYPTGGGSYPSIMDKSSNGYDGWNFYLLSGTGYGYFANNAAYREEGSVLTLNQWQHLCATWDGGTTAATAIDVFMNGASVSAGSSAINGGGLLNDAAYNLRIGIFGDMADPFQGRIDEVRIYNRVLTLSEIQALAAQ